LWCGFMFQAEISGLFLRNFWAKWVTSTLSWTLVHALTLVMDKTWNIFL
jgi:hypothetical protein